MISPLPRPTPRERRRSRTREELVQVALRLFLAQGFEETTVEQIADAADMSTRNFFRYFTTKEQVVFELLREGDRDIVEAVAARPREESALDALREGFLGVVARHSNEEMVKLARLIVKTPSLYAHTAEHSKPLEQELTLCVAARLGGDAKTDLRSRVLAALAVRAWKVAAEHWLEGGCRDQLANQVRSAFAIAADLGGS